ncbi:MAG: cobalamin biosynthesis protein [Rhizonema sp. NSF051]|nr:cobalamin biosynthesis protein [Rhizonema sp. NSF051]
MIKDRSQEIGIRSQELLFFRSPHPLLLWVGIGCNKGVSRQMLEAAIEHVFRENQLAESAIAGIATIDVKIDEVGLIELCLERNFPIQIFSSEILRSVCVPNPNKAIEKEMGTFSVAEAAAMRAAQCQNLLVPKKIFRSLIPNQKGAVTIAIAQQLPRSRN